MRRPLLTCSFLLLTAMGACSSTAVSTAPQPPATSTTSKTPASSATTASGTGVRTVDATQAVTLISGGSTVIDVRTADEFAGGHVKGAVNIDLQQADFAGRIGALDRTKSYVVYCRSGNRSATAAAQMKAAGFTDVADAGGFSALVTAGAPAQ